MEKDPPAKEQREAQGALYNSRIVAFLYTQLETVQSVEVPASAAEEDVARFYKILGQGKRFIAKHAAVFDVRSYYWTRDACGAVEQLCGRLRELLEDWRLKAAAEVQVNIPKRDVEEDENLLRKLLTYTLKGGECSVEGEMAKRWKASRRLHAENMRLLQIIDEEDLRLEQRLGDGGQGVVYRAVWQSAKVAVKKSRKELGHDLPIEEFAEFLKEVLLHATLNNHPNVVQLHATTASGWIVMELAQTDLHALCHTEGPLAWGLKARLLCHGAVALAYIHAQNWIHGDVKSLNFLVFGTYPDGYQVKISDFGLALEVAQSRSKTVRIGGGTPQWVAPEFYDDKPITQASDVYSFGAVCYEVISQKYLYGWANPCAIMAKKLCGEEPCPVALHDCPPQMLELMRRCCALNPAERPTMKEVSNIMLQLPKEWGGKDGKAQKVSPSISAELPSQSPGMSSQITARIGGADASIPEGEAKSLGEGQLTSTVYQVPNPGNVSGHWGIRLPEANNDLLMAGIAAALSLLIGIGILYQDNIESFLDVLKTDTEPPGLLWYVVHTGVPVAAGGLLGFLIFQHLLLDKVRKGQS